MDGKDIETRLKQNIQFLRDRSGSGQVPPEYLCQLLEEIAHFLGQAYGRASDASDSSKGVMNKIQALERRFTPRDGTGGGGGGGGSGGISQGGGGGGSS